MLNSATTSAAAYEPKPSLIGRQVYLIFVHFINLLSNILGNDFLSCKIRGGLISLLGAKLDRGSTIKGGGYIYGGKLSTGVGCHINRNCYFDFTARITFGNHVVVGHGVTFITAEHQIGSSQKRAGQVLGREIVVEDGAWIGANATILPGVSISKGAIVAAGAVVTQSVAPNVTVGGIPAKVIKALEA